MKELSKENPIVIDEHFGTFTKYVFVEEAVGEVSNKKYIFGERYISKSSDGPWERMSDWVWYP